MKQKRKQHYQWSLSEKLVWLLYAIIALSLFFTFISLLPQHFEIQPHLIPTADYLQQYPEDNVLEISIVQVSQTSDGQYDVCLKSNNDPKFRIDGSWNWQMYIDGQYVRSLSSKRTVDGFYRCASHIYLAKGSHLVEYRNQDTIYTQKWTIEIK